MIIIQHIKTQWTKQSRGMPHAQVRANVPDVFLLPELASFGTVDIASKPLLIHRVDANEINAFEPFESFEIYVSGNYLGLFFECHQNIIDVRFRHDYYMHGKPIINNQHKSKIFALKPNDTANFKINGRFASYSGQSYTQHIVNIQHLENQDDYQTDIFLQGKPDTTVSFLNDLF